jgi:hypothetical protein
LVIILFSYTSYMADMDLSATCALPFKYLYCLSSVVRLLKKESIMLLMYRSKFKIWWKQLCHYSVPINNISSLIMQCVMAHTEEYESFFAPYSRLLHSAVKLNK